MIEEKMGDSLYGWLFLILVLIVAAFMLFRDSIKRRRAEQEYRDALLNLRRNKTSPDARIRASRAGALHYGLRHKEGKPTLFDQEQITKEIQEATGEAASMKAETKPVVKNVREAKEYRSL